MAKYNDIEYSFGIDEHEKPAVQSIENGEEKLDELKLSISFYHELERFKLITFENAIDMIEQFANISAQNEKAYYEFVYMEKLNEKESSSIYKDNLNRLYNLVEKCKKAREFIKKNPPKPMTDEELAEFFATNSPPPDGINPYADLTEDELFEAFCSSLDDYDDCLERLKHDKMYNSEIEVSRRMNDVVYYYTKIWPCLNHGLLFPPIFEIFIKDIVNADLNPPKPIRLIVTAPFIN